MRNNETGELEFVVGNRQIMSGFFIVVLLFAVGVAMGYFLGQNSPRSAKMVPETSAAAPAGAADGRPQPAAPAQPAPQATPPAASDGQQQPPAEASPQPSTQPVRDGSTAAPAAEPPAAPSAVTEAPPGAYWQVMAVQGKSDADVVVRTLKNKGFPATVSPGTKGLTRVLVGPYPERAAQGRAKTDLEAAGFNGLYKVEIGK
ncbi:MAG: SPOR domain-containing protein [Candidatus Sulfopaludibacter sp.]|nr:SPOR domain-containing protein [Candidatus Sulfopaludibacter sp.]